MAEVGKTDVFERLYMEKFRAFAAKFGEFVAYERDRGARDLGLHLTHKLSSGKERLSSALCWFQMKGIMAASFSKKAFEKGDEVKLSLDVGHLRYWFLQPIPTYLVVYIESVDTFLIQNIQDYVAKTWGKAILTLDQKTTTVSISKNSVLDEQAFNLLLTKSDIKEWVRALETDEESARLCRRDYDLIWHFGTAVDRKVKHRVDYWNWQSKTRDQFFIQEKPIEGEGDWETLREHWQLQSGASDLEDTYPYLEFFALEDVDEENFWGEEEAEDSPILTISNGDVVVGVNCANEYFEFVLGARLNELGQQLFESVSTLEKVGLIEITRGISEWVSIAPWHHRAV
ncbi:MAG TPA: DUF4365 domain-containing protein [Candidatus Binatia bacterium]|nr:DUF4365 domain-containing protein [Candidatus Binatia bacterium]